MAAPSGIAGQIGFKSETVWGTAVTPDTFHPGLTSENIKQDIARIESQGIRAGRRVAHTWKAGGKTISGDINLELFNQPLASLLTHMFGDVQTTGAGPYTHTATPGSLTGKSLTVQVGRPDVGGTVRAFTYDGVKFSGWEIACSVGEIPTLTLNCTAESETTATALATASYPAAATPFVFTEASLSIAGTAVGTVNAMSLSCAMGLAADRHRIGSATVKEQLEANMREFTGTVETDFESLTAYERFTAGTEAALVMVFDNGTDSLTITCNVRFDGETPELGGIEALTQTLPFKAISSTSDAAAITAVLVSDTEASAA